MPLSPTEVHWTIPTRICRAGGSGLAGPSRCCTLPACLQNGNNAPDLGTQSFSCRNLPRLGPWQCPDLAPEQELVPSCCAVSGRWPQHGNQSRRRRRRHGTALSQHHFTFGVYPSSQPGSSTSLCSAKVPIKTSVTRREVGDTSTLRAQQQLGCTTLVSRYCWKQRFVMLIF